MSLPRHPYDRPPKGWTFEMAVGAGLVALAVVIGAILGAILYLAW